MLATHRDAEERYSKIRQAVLDEVNREFVRSDSGNIKAKLIEGVALTASKKWQSSLHRLVDWDWFEGYSAFRFRYPKRFEMALWHNGQLASLSLGRPTFRGTKLRLDFIEANPDKPTDIKIFQPTFIAMAAYAHALDADELRVMNPINNSVREYYERFGLTYVSQRDYLYIKL